MFFLHLTLIIASLTLVKAEAILGLGPLRFEQDLDIIIQATLTDEMSQAQWQLEEKAAGRSIVQGVIDIKSGTKDVAVFYDENNDDSRLVFYDNQCILSMFDNNEWTSQLPGVSKPLTNLILMLGPSIIYRLIESEHIWLQGNNTKIRGYNLEKFSTTIGNVLDISLYTHTVNDIRTANSIRVEFQGSVPGMLVQTIQEHLILDIYLKESTSKDLAGKIQPRPGVGCPRYLSANKRFPGISDKSFRASIYDSIKDSPTASFGPGKLVEVFVDASSKFIRVTKNSEEPASEGLYDYRLGVFYASQLNDFCLTRPLEADDLAVYDNQFSVNELVWMNGPYKYVGEMFDEFRSGIISSVWEATKYNMSFNGRTYDKVVTTQYLAKTGAIYETVYTYIPIGAMRYFYKKSATSGYQLISIMRRDIFEYSPSVSIENYADLFQLDFCYDKPEDRKTLQFSIRPTSSQDSQIQESLSVAQSYIDFLKKNLVAFIQDNVHISPIRIDHIDLDFQTDRILASVEFVREPVPSASFKDEYRAVQVDSTLEDPSIGKAKDREECIRALLSKQPNTKNYVYCETGICSPVDDLSKIKNDPKGTQCQILSRGIGDPMQILQEIPLESIHDALLNENQTPYQFKVQTQSKSYSFMIDDIIEKTEQAKKEAYKTLYTIASFGTKLSSAKSEVRSYSGDIRDFGDCYRLCADSEELPCETFAYCENGKQVDCLITSSLLHRENLTEDSDWIEYDQNCNLYTPNYASSFHKIPNSEFTNIVDTPEQVFSEDECANKCVSSENCKSFQLCEDNSLCSFGGLVTAKNTKPSSKCNIYSPKTINMFHSTGKEIIMEIETVELDIGIDQCAMLCLAWTDSSHNCKSFNFCPKSKSSTSLCQLTEYTVGTPGVKTSSTQNCRNYQLNDGLMDNKQANQKVINKTNGAAAFGIIMVFLFVGLIFGGASNFIYRKINCQLISSQNFTRSFKWSKQVDEDEQNVI